MGAIFAAGGLVVALAAVIVVLTVEDRVKRSFDSQLPRIVEQADKQIEAYLTFLEARWSAVDWREKVRLGRQAIQQYPGLRPKVSAYLARRLAQDVIADFAKGHTRLYIQYTGPPQMNPRADDALHYINDAQESGDDVDGEMTALAALMYGAIADYHRLIRTIRAGKVAHAGFLDQLTPTPRLALLAAACESDTQRLHELGVTLERTLPVDAGEVLQSIHAIDLSVPTGETHKAEWIIVGKRGAWYEMNITAFPATAQVLTWLDAGTRVCRIQLVPASAGVQNSAAWTDIDQMTPQAAVEILNRYFLFICPDTTRWEQPLPGEPMVATG